MSKTIYSFDPVSGAFKEQREADQCPLDHDQYLVPAFCTETPPPATEAKHIAVYANACWSIAPDHRGETWYQADGVPMLVHEIGDPAAMGLTAEPPTPPAPTVADVITERERRLSLGFDYDFKDARGVHRIGTTPADMIGWDEVTKSASALINLGQPATPMPIVTNTGPVTLTALEWQQVLVAATQFRQPIWMASFVLQAMTPIPDDYATDTHWHA